MIKYTFDSSNMDYIKYFLYFKVLYKPIWKFNKIIKRFSEEVKHHECM